jgi:hypothetical protein
MPLCKFAYCYVCVSIHVSSYVGIKYANKLVCRFVRMYLYARIYVLIYVYMHVVGTYFSMHVFLYAYICL